MQTGHFITFEGIEGSGKSTQIQRAAQALQALGHKVLLTREPGGTEISEAIRNILIDPKNTVMEARTELLLYAAARRQHLQEKILPALERGEIVLCDRFSDSTRAYQGAARKLPPDVIEHCISIATEDREADLTLLFDCSVKSGLGRAQARNQSAQHEDRFDNENTAFHERVRQGYLSLAKKYSQRFRILNAEKNIDELHQDVMKILTPLMVSLSNH